MRRTATVRTTLAIASCVLMVWAASGCAESEGRRATTGVQPDSSGESAAPEAMFDEYFVQPDDFAGFLMVEAPVVRPCLEQNGVDELSPAVDYSQVYSDLAGEAPPSDSAVPASEAMEYLPGKPSQQDRDILAQCLASPDNPVSGWRDFIRDFYYTPGSVSELVDGAELNVSTDTEVQASIRAWAECFEGRGHKLPDAKGESMSYIPADQLEEPTEQSIKDDEECLEKSSYLTVLNDTEERIYAQLLSDESAQFAEWKQQLEQLRKLRDESLAAQ